MYERYTRIEGKHTTNMSMREASAAMARDDLKICGLICTVYRCDAPRFLLLQPADGHDLETLGQEAKDIRQKCSLPFLLCAFRVEDWDGDLTPWTAPALYGKTPFRGGAAQTLKRLTGELLPELCSRYGLHEDTPIILGGYSLAGLFSLWCGCETDRFAAIAASSPSVWYEGWTEYAARHAMRSKAVCLSLGDREEKAKNPRLAAVGRCIRTQKELLDRQGVPSVLVWHPGNHFQDPPGRTAQAFAWAMERLGE